MLKKGFTLQELLITMAIVGVIAALVIPQLANMIPDKNKTIYMKAYNTLMNQTDEIVSDSGLYYTTYDDSGTETCTGMYCKNQPMFEPYSNDNKCRDETKFATILSKKLNLKGDPTYNNDTTAFTTSDGVEWTFETTEVNVTASVKGYRTDITINVNPSDNNNSHNCLYSANCTKPNQFKFEIDNYGGVRAADALGIAYLQTPTDMHSASKDMSLASEIVADTVDGMYTKLQDKLKLPKDGCAKNFQANNN